MLGLDTQYQDTSAEVVQTDFLHMNNFRG